MKNEEVEELKKDGTWDLLNGRMRMFFEHDWEELPVPVVPVRDSAGPLTSLAEIFYAAGIVDTLYRVTRSENINFDPFFNNQPFTDADHSEAGDIYVFVPDKREYAATSHHRTMVPRLLIAKLGICLGEHDGTKLFLGGLPSTGYRIHGLERMKKFCRLNRDPELNPTLRIYRKALFEPPEARALLEQLLLKKDTTYIGD